MMTIPYKGRIFAKTLIFLLIFFLLIFLFIRQYSFVPNISLFSTSSKNSSKIYYDNGYGFSEPQTFILEQQKEVILSKKVNDINVEKITIHGSNLREVIFNEEAEFILKKSENKIELNIKPDKNHNVYTTLFPIVFLVPDKVGIDNISLNLDNEIYNTDVSKGKYKYILIERDNMEIAVRGISKFRIDEMLPRDANKKLFIKENNSTSKTIFILSDGKTKIKRYILNQSQIEQGAEIDLNYYKLSFHPVVNIVQIFSSLILSILIFNFIMKFKGYFSDPSSREKTLFFTVIFLALFLYYMFWLLGQWPGFCGWDSLIAVYQVRSMNFFIWYSLIYPLIALSIHQIYDAYTSIIIFQTIITCILFSYSLTKIYSFYPTKFLGTFTFLLLLLPNIFIYNFFYTRDVFNGIFTCALLILLYVFTFENRYYGVNKRTFIECFVFLVLIFLVINIRIDNIAIVIASVGCAVFFRLFKKKHLIVSLLIVFSMQICLKTFESQMLDRNRLIADKKLYLSFPAFHNLSGLLHGGYIPNNEEQQMIEKFIPVNELRDRFKPGDLIAVQNYFTENNVYARIHSTSYRDLFRLYLIVAKGYILYPHIMIPVRLRTFGRVIGSRKGWKFSDHSLQFKDDPVWLKKLKDNNVFRDTYMLSKTIFSIQNYIIFRIPIIVTNIPFAVICLIVVFLFKYIPITAFLCFTLWLRLMIIFLTSSAGHYFYTYDLSLFGSFILLMSYVEYKKNITDVHE